MNFDFIPLGNQAGGFWWILGSMLAIATGLAFLFLAQALSGTKRLRA